MFPVTVTTLPDGTHHLNMYIFSVYATQMAKRLIHHMPYFISQTIMSEQKLPCLRIQAMCLTRDSNSLFLPDPYVPEGADFTYSTNAFSANNTYDPDTYSEEGHSFYKQFQDVKIWMDRFFSKPGYEELTDMGQEILPGYEFEYQKDVKPTT